MSRAVLIILLAALTTAAGAPAATRPTLAIVRSIPSVTVHGAHFRAGEKVRLSLSSGLTRMTRQVVASRQGTFTAALGALTVFDPCTVSYAVVAVGAGGRLATVKFIPRECPPAS